MYPGIKQEKNEFSSNYFEKSFIDKIVAAKAKLVNKSKDDLKELEEIGKEQFKAICIEDSDNDKTIKTLCK